MLNVSELVGQTLTNIERINGDEELIFVTLDGLRYRMYHKQSCCEAVYLESIVGELEDILNSLILIAEEVSNQLLPPKISDYEPESYTWTFYNFSTINGSVQLRWYGSSNGYYSECVDFEKLTN